MTKVKPEIAARVEDALAQSHPRLTASQRRIVATEFAGNWLFEGQPTVYEIGVHVGTLESQRPELFRAVPSKAAVAAHITKNLSDPVERIRQTRRVEGMSDDELLATLPVGAEASVVN